MLQCNLGISDESTTPMGMQLVTFGIMLIVAASAFMSNFQKKKTAQNLLLACSGAFLLVYCYLAYRQQSAGAIFSVFPLLAVGITPILGNYIDKKGKAATMLIFGSLLLIICHLTFAYLLPLFKPEMGGVSGAGGFILAFVTILVLGASFSLVPASLWPSVPKLVDSKVIGSAYAMIFWIQNIGLWLFPLLIGKILNASNQDIINDGSLTAAQKSVMYDYTNPLLMLACLGAVALLLGFYLKVVDRKKGFGLELPNINK
jgi:hypothetical protein